MISVDDLIGGPGERHIVYGGTRTGKSSFMDWDMRYVQEHRPTAMQLVADTKPRFRAETLAYGPGNRYRKSAEKAGIYRHWASGPVVPNSVALDWSSSHPFRGMWAGDKNEDRIGEICIMQSDDPVCWRRMNDLMHHFVAAKVQNRERRLVVDEALDFYQRNTLGIDAKKDPILRTARAGGERNIGILIGAHRPHGLPPLLNTLSSRVTLFHLRLERDMRYLYEMGVPESEVSPDGDYVFQQYKVAAGGKVEGPEIVRMAYPESYLKQLAAT
jgi:hypothetical protein